LLIKIHLLGAACLTEREKRGGRRGGKEYLSKFYISILGGKKEGRSSMDESIAIKRKRGEGGGGKSTIQNAHQGKRRRGGGGPEGIL